MLINVMLIKKHVEAISLSALPKDKTSELASLSFLYPFFLCWTSSRKAVSTNF